MSMTFGVTNWINNKLSLQENQQKIDHKEPL